MEHPAVCLHGKCTDNESTDDVGLYVLAISGSGLCYFWYGKDLEDLRNANPTKILLFVEEHGLNGHKGVLPMIFSTEIQGVVKPGSVHVLFAYGSLINPSFEKKLVQYGVDITLNSSQVGVLLPMGQSHKSPKTKVVQTQGMSSLSKLFCLNLLKSFFYQIMSEMIEMFTLRASPMQKDVTVHLGMHSVGCGSLLATKT